VPDHEAFGVSVSKPNWSWDDEFEGGFLSCGELLLALREHFHTLTGGTRVLVHSADPGAYIDIPAWCWLTGHELAGDRHPYYLITVHREGEDSNGG
jgi:tRNA 2-thiouridine synthesizing protein A